MKQAYSKDQALLADIRDVLARGASHLWWLGQSGFLIVRRGRALLLDPYLSDSLTRKYAGTDKPHVRITERVIDPRALAGLGVIDVVTSSHAHTDHLDAETLLPILNRNPQAKLVIPAANHEIVQERLGEIDDQRLVGLDHGASAKLGSIVIHGIASAHNTVDRDSSGRCKYLGYVVQWEDLSLYHSGDTLMHEGLVSALRRFKPHLALLPINGDKPERRVAGNLNGTQAARLGHDIGARCVVPCHFDLFEFNTATPDEFIAACTRLHQQYCVLGNGQGMPL